MILINTINKKYLDLVHKLIGIKILHKMIFKQNNEYAQYCKFQGLKLRCYKQ